MQQPKVHEKSYTVTDQQAIHFMGVGVLPVLSTPSLIEMMEMTSRENVSSLLGPGEDSVGISVEVRHLAATPVGMTVRVISRLTNVEGRVYKFEVEALDEIEKVAEGTHERASVAVSKFAGRVATKREKAAHAG